ncbi:OLC1v1036307C1 [Oldenlandia corymbosa var. corymbosa]|uniref:OLC1v1036307C1 n=1 Tax=Oldenlandia corymbosa var. corymbosa TaxID=529605 RepID=A0AAV1CWY7_OLDCO|nr:OLC1v1036307C1 [Oldenlandia corymbosa var. corymbosa]
MTGRGTLTDHVEKVEGAIQQILEKLKMVPQDQVVVPADLVDLKLLVMGLVAKIEKMEETLSSGAGSSISVADGLVDMQPPIGGDTKEEVEKDKFLAKEKVVEPAKVDGNGNGSKGKGKGCFKCGKEGHRIRECPLWAKNGAVPANTLQVEEVANEEAIIPGLGIMQVVE